MVGQESLPSLKEGFSRSCSSNHRAAFPEKDKRQESASVSAQVHCGTTIEILQ